MGDVAGSRRVPPHRNLLWFLAALGGAIVLATVAGVGIGTGWFGTSKAPPPAAGASPTPMPPTPSPSPSPSPPAQASPLPTPSPAPSPRPSPAAPTTFSGTVLSEPGARIRFGPELDMPVVDVAPAGSVQKFDGWYRNLGDAPVADNDTGRIEPWSRDWLHLANGGGWIHSAVVSVRPPAGMPQTAWTRPAVLPAATAAVLDVPYYAQEQHATCEVASLKMALASRGVFTGEPQLLDQVGVDARAPVVDAGGNIVRWADPNQVFVGQPGGSWSALTGYGVYAGPIARVAKADGLTVVSSGAGHSAQRVYAEVLAGHPVIAWVTSVYQRVALRTWTSWAGATVRWAPYEHAAVVVGITPGYVIVNDPWWGVIWKPRADFEAAFSTFDGMAVVVG